jgi:hypothetical protein
MSFEQKRYFYNTFPTHPISYLYTKNSLNRDIKCDIPTFRGGLAPQILVGIFFKGPPKKVTENKKKKKVNDGGGGPWKKSHLLIWRIRPCLHWKIKSWQPCHFLVRRLAASKKNKCLLFGQELSICQFSSRSEKVGLRALPLQTFSITHTFHVFSVSFCYK